MSTQYRVDDVVVYNGLMWDVVSVNRDSSLVGISRSVVAGVRSFVRFVDGRLLVLVSGDTLDYSEAVAAQGVE